MKKLIQRLWISLFGFRQRTLPMPNSLNPHLQKSYASTDGLHEWYTYREPAVVPYVRKLKIDEAVKLANMGMTLEFLNESLDHAMQACTVETGKKINIADVYMILQEMKVRANLIVERDTLLHLVASCFLLDNENPYKFEDNLHSRKVELLRADQEAQNFFFPVLQSWLPTLKTMSATDLQNYLEKTERMMAKVKNPFMPTSSGSTTMPTTSPR